LIKRTGKF